MRLRLPDGVPFRGFMRLPAPLLAVSLPVLILGALALASTRPGSLDDAFVLLAHIRALSLGHGFVLGPGGAPVEAFTSTADFLIKAPLLGGAGDPVRALWLVTGGLYAVSILVVVGAGFLLLTDRGWLRPGMVGLFAVASAALALSPGLAEGTSYLLEAPILAIAIAGAAVWIPGPSRGPLSDCRAVGAAWILALARPEGVPVALWLLICRARSRPSGAWRATGAWLLGILIWLAWRLATFGTWAPNAYHAKRSEGIGTELADGLGYLLDALAGAGPAGGDWLRSMAVLAALLAGLSSLLPQREDERQDASSRTRALAGAWVISLVALICSGGDGYAGLRLFFPVALWGLLAAISVLSCGDGTARRVALASLLVVAGARLAAVIPDAPSKLLAILGPPPGEESFAEMGQIASALSSALEEEALAHRHFQGARWFEPDLAIVDLTGLTDPEIARTPVEGSVRFGRWALRPGLERNAGAFLLHHALWSREPLADRPLEETLADPARVERLLGHPPPDGEESRRLIAGYRGASLPGVAGPGTWVNVLIRADLAGRFEAAGFALSPD